MEIMKKLPKKWWLANRVYNSLKNCKQIMLAVLFSHSNINAQQIANYVSNGSFEVTHTCTVSDFSLKNVKFWNSLDSTNNKFGGVYTNNCNVGNNCCEIPLNIYSFQYPRNGEAYVLGQFYDPLNNRGFLKNRIKHPLQNGKVYCAKMYVNLAHECKYGIDAIGMFFSDNTIDTIQRANNDLPYIIPQIISQTVITDTLNWVPITGTFVANGNEKYLVIGCFKPNSSINYSVTNLSAVEWAGYNIDDVSCIPVDLPAYAYQSPDAWILPGDSLYLGRERDVGIDEACMWYQLPNTTTAIDTAAGIWVKPMQTTSYLVKQDICGNIKWALVTVNISDVGLAYPELAEGYLFKLYPNPASNEITIAFNNEADFTKPKELKIINVLGREVKTLLIENKTQKINIEELSNGVYYLQLQTPSGVKVIKKLVKE